MQISSYLKKDLILFLKGGDKRSVLIKMIEKAAGAGQIDEPDKFREAVEERETIMSTGLGRAVAVPHAKIAGIEDFFIVLAVLEDPAEWDSLDKQPVRIVFLIGAPENRLTDYLKLLSKIVLLIKNEERRVKLLESTTPDEVSALFEEL